MLKLQYSQQSGLPPLWSVQSVPAPEVGLSIKPISVLESLVANSPALTCGNLFLLFGNGKANQVTRVAVRRSLAGMAAGVLGADPAVGRVPLAVPAGRGGCHHWFYLSYTLFHLYLDVWGLSKLLRNSQLRYLIFFFN